MIHEENIFFISIQINPSVALYGLFKKILSCIKKLLAVWLTFRAFRRIINVSEATALTSLSVEAFLKLTVFEKLIVFVIFFGIALE